MSEPVAIPELGELTGKAHDIERLNTLLEIAFEHAFPYKGCGSETFGREPPSDEYRQYLVTKAEWEAIRYGITEIGFIARKLVEELDEADCALMSLRHERRKDSSPLGSRESMDSPDRSGRA